MTNAELIQAFRSEIEMRIKECEATYPKDKGGYWFPEQEEAYAIAEEYKQLLSFLGTLEDGASEKPNNHMEIVNDLTSEVPTRAVQLPDGRWVTEAFANNNCIYGRKPEERHCEYCSANCSTGHDFQRTKDLDEAANAYSNEHNDDCFDAIGSVCPHIIDAFIAGAKWQKEQMLKEAVKCEYDQYPAAIYLPAPIPRMNKGDMVRIIIVKEDEK